MQKMATILFAFVFGIGIMPLAAMQRGAELVSQKIRELDNLIENCSSCCNEEQAKAIYQGTVQLINECARKGIWDAVFGSSDKEGDFSLSRAIKKQAFEVFAALMRPEIRLYWRMRYCNSVGETLYAIALEQFENWSKVSLVGYECGPRRKVVERRRQNAVLIMDLMERLVPPPSPRRILRQSCPPPR